MVRRQIPLKIAQILYNKAHWIFESEEMPSFPPGPDGTPIILIDITDKPEVQEGWDYNTKTGEFAESILLDLPPVQESLKDQIQGLQQAIAELTILLAGGEA